MKPAQVTVKKNCKINIKIIKQNRMNSLILVFYFLKL